MVAISFGQIASGRKMEAGAGRRFTHVGNYTASRLYVRLFGVNHNASDIGSNRTADIFGPNHLDADRALHRSDNDERIVDGGSCPADSIILSISRHFGSSIGRFDRTATSKSNFAHFSPFLKNKIK